MAGIIDTWRGVWDSHTQYAYGDVVVHPNGSTYLAIGSVPRGKDPTTGNPWVYVSWHATGIIEVWRGLWQDGRQYAYGDLVVRPNGNTYLALQTPPIGKTPESGDPWVPLYAGAGGGGGAVSSVAASNGTVTVAPTTGAVKIAAKISAQAGNLLGLGSDGGLFVDPSGDGMLDWINVKDHGATGDGVTNDAPSIQTAISLCPPGGIVYFPAGNYGIAAPIIVPPGVTLLMAHSNMMLVPDLTDPKCQISVLPAFAGAAAILFLNQPDGGYDGIPAEHRLINVMVDGTAKTDTAVDGIQAKGNIQNIVMEGVTIKKMSGNGIYTDIGGDGRFPYSWRLYRVMVDNCAGHGFSFAVMTDITMFDCQAIGNFANGFQLRNLANSQMTLCRAEWNGNHGYNFTGDWGTAAGSGALVATGCSTDRNGWDGLHIECTGTPPIVFNGLMLRRDGRNGGPGGGGYAGLAAIGATTPLVISGVTVFPGTDDQGTQTSSPEVGIKLHTNTMVILDEVYAHVATTPMDVAADNVLVQIGPNIVLVTGPTDAPAVAPTADWGWRGTATAKEVAATDNVLAAQVIGEAAPRAVVRADGLQVFGDGTGAPDTPGWYREQAGNLKTDAYVNMNAGGQAGGNFTSWSPNPKALMAGAGGGGISVAEGGGATARMGQATLVGGTVTVQNTSVEADTRIFLSRGLVGGTPGHLSSTITPGASFTITSSEAADTSTVSWLLVEPA